MNVENWTRDDFVGGHPLLDFLNTVDDYGKTREQDKLIGWERFVAWTWMSASCDDGPLWVPSNVSAISPSTHELGELIALREAAHAVLSALVGGREIPADHLGYVSQAISNAYERASFGFSERSWTWTADGKDASWLIDTLALKVEDFLRSQDMSRLRECGRCTWLFINQGRGVGRRWCKMKTCGNRAKAQSFRERS